MKRITLSLGEDAVIGLERVRVVGIGHDAVELQVEPRQRHDPLAWLVRTTEEASARDGLAYLLVESIVTLIDRNERGPYVTREDQADAAERRAAVARIEKGRTEWGEKS